MSLFLLSLSFQFRWYKYTIEDVRALQQTIQDKVAKQQADIEKKALNILQSPTSSTDDPLTAVKNLLTDFHEKTASSVRDQWWDFFWVMVGKYRDQMM